MIRVNERHDLITTALGVRNDGQSVWVHTHHGPCIVIHDRLLVGAIFEAPCQANVFVRIGDRSGLAVHVVGRTEETGSDRGLTY